ncbi:MAG: hypothetical protein ABI200_03040, partial [Gaiellales bacterium]
ATIEITRPATLEFRNGSQIGQPGNCSAIVFGQWKDVPGTDIAHVHYTWAGKQETESKGAPYHDQFSWLAEYAVTPGYHWIVLGKSWANGGPPDDCVDMAEKNRTFYDLSPAATYVTLSLEVPNPTIKLLRGKTKLGTNRRVDLANVICPTGGSCTIKVPKQTSIYLGSKRYNLTVNAPKRLLSGKRAKVSVTFPKAAARALKGRQARPNVQIMATHRKVASISKTTVRIVRG